MQNPQLNGLTDVAASVIVNAFDAYGWPMLVTTLAVTLLGFTLLLCCWADIELGDFDGIIELYRFVRSSWRKKTRGLKIS